MSLDENGMEAFEYTALPARVLFGFDIIARVPDELVSLGRKRAFVLSDPHHATAAAARISSLTATSIWEVMRYSRSSRLSSFAPI
jgi:hypothetical protein